MIDYGQVPAQGEKRSAEVIASELDLEVETLAVDCSPVGSGCLAGQERLPMAPAAEWWPFRNQLLATLGAAWALARGGDVVVLGSVKTDGFHVDGTCRFYAALDSLVSGQEGSIRISVPAIEMTTVELVRRSGIAWETLAWSHSCHRSSLACGSCPGCIKRNETIVELGWHT